MAKMHMRGLRRQLQDWQGRQVKKPIQGADCDTKAALQVGCFKIPSVTFEYCTAEDHSKETIILEESFMETQTLSCNQKDHSKETIILKESFIEAQTLSYTHKLHCVIHASKNQVGQKCFQKYVQHNKYYTLAR
jgi:hypothetical protein